MLSERMFYREIFYKYQKRMNLIAVYYYYHLLIFFLQILIAINMSIII